MKFKIGDKVSFLNEQGSGTVLSILTNFRVMVLNQDGFEVAYATDQLVPVGDMKGYVVDKRISDQKEEQEIKPPKLTVDEAWEVDLHLHELDEHYLKKSDHEKLLLQLKHFHKCMDAAIQYRVKKVIFIHGVGKGTLKAEIIHALKKYERIRHFDAPLKKYGFGATIVEFY